MRRGYLTSIGRAHWFTRALCPTWRHGHPAQRWLIHCGVYLFNTEWLRRNYPAIDTTPSAADSEQLEQLDWLQRGHDIMVAEGKGRPSSPIDTESDYAHWKQGLASF